MTLPLFDVAKTLREEYPLDKDLVLAIRKFLIAHAESLPSRYEPKSILESRFMPAKEAYERGVLSCGAMVNMATEMLRSVGLKVKLIHGESADSVHHAWLALFDPTSGSWVEYDLTQKDVSVPHTNIKKLECESWEEIRGDIEKGHKTYKEDMAKRGLE